MAVELRAWPTSEELEANRQRALVRVRAQIASFEEQLGMTSDEMQAALANGTALETPEVGDWLMCLHTLRMLERGKQA